MKVLLLLSFTLLLLIGVTCDTVVVSDEVNCSRSSGDKQCHSRDPDRQLLPQAEAQSRLASIETAAAAAVAATTSQKAFSLDTPFAEPKAAIDKLNGIPAAFGDFDSDHFVDLFFITNDGYSIQAMKGKDCSDGKTVLSLFGDRDCLINWTGLECPFTEPIVNLVPSDFTGQNRLDLLVTVKEVNKGTFKIYLASGGSTDLNCSNMNDILTDVLSEPFVLDYNGDMIMDFIVSTRTCKTYLWLGHNVTESEIVTAPYSNRKPSGICLKNLTDDEFVFAKPHSSAFLNLEHYQKNMNTDIFLAGEKEIKYIYNVEEQGFSMKENISYPKHKLRGQSAFMDFNYAGQMTHLIPVCLESKAGNFKDCRSIGLVAWHHDTRQWINVLDPEPANVSVNPNNRTLSFSEQSFFYNEITVPVALRVGDLNYDGYPDFATILVDVQSGRTFAAIYLNMADNNTEALSNPFKRKFQLCWLSEGRYAESIAMVSLFDLYDNGRLVLLLTKFNQEQGNTLQTVSYDYYIDHRLYYSFIRVTVITGRCTDKEGDQNVQCPKVRGKDQVALGSNPHGPNVCFAGPYTTQHSCSAQLTQSAHFALQLPYMIFGLGDILNVVSDLKVSIPNGAGKTRRRAWEEDIPGSKLVIVPYQLDQPENWYKRVYINMGIYSMFSLAFLCILCVFLIIAIYFLHCRERKEDRKDHMEYKKHWL